MSNERTNIYKLDTRNEGLFAIPKLTFLFIGKNIYVKKTIFTTKIKFLTLLNFLKVNKTIKLS